MTLKPTPTENSIPLEPQTLPRWLRSPGLVQPRDKPGSISMGTGVSFPWSKVMLCFGEQARTLARRLLSLRLKRGARVAIVA